MGCLLSPPPPDRTRLKFSLLAVCIAAQVLHAVVAALHVGDKGGAGVGELLTVGQEAGHRVGQLGSSRGWEGGRGRKRSGWLGSPGLLLSNQIGWEVPREAQKQIRTRTESIRIALKINSNQTHIIPALPLLTCPNGAIGLWAHFSHSSGKHDDWSVQCVCFNHQPLQTRDLWLRTHRGRVGPGAASSVSNRKSSR